MFLCLLTQSDCLVAGTPRKGSTTNNRKRPTLTTLYFLKGTCDKAVRVIEWYGTSKTYDNSRPSNQEAREHKDLRPSAAQLVNLFSVRATKGVPGQKNPQDFSSALDGRSPRRRIRHDRFRILRNCASRELFGKVSLLERAWFSMNIRIG